MLSPSDLDPPATLFRRDQPMARPKAYDPQPGYKHQILCRNQAYSRSWEHCDYAIDAKDKRHLIENYRLAYGAGWEFQSIMLPARFWPDWTKVRRFYRERHPDYRSGVTNDGVVGRVPVSQKPPEDSRWWTP